MQTGMSLKVRYSEPEHPVAGVAHTSRSQARTGIIGAGDCAVPSAAFLPTALKDMLRDSKRGVICLFEQKNLFPVVRLGSRINSGRRHAASAIGSASKNYCWSKQEAIACRSNACREIHHNGTPRRRTGTPGHRGKLAGYSTTPARSRCSATTTLCERPRVSRRLCRGLIAPRHTEPTTRYPPKSVMFRPSCCESNRRTHQASVLCP
jgi:hypothetical protein